MPHMRLFQSMETVNITFLYLLLRRAEYFGQGERFLWLICSRREHLAQDRSLFRLQLLQVHFEADFSSFYSTWKLRPYIVVTLFRLVNRKIVWVLKWLQYSLKHESRYKWCDISKIRSHRSWDRCIEVDVEVEGFVDYLTSSMDWIAKVYNV